jgi:hypothetical protein
MNKLLEGSCAKFCKNIYDCLEVMKVFPKIRPIHKIWKIFNLKKKNFGKIIFTKNIYVNKAYTFHYLLQSYM